jgi:hypothetical protein
MASLPDLRYEAVRDHLLQAIAILPVQGGEVIKLLLEEACRRCEARTFRDGDAAYFHLPDPRDHFDPLKP